ncbi:MAG: 30S ribosomal protein S20 [Candidatus Peribacteria bacterium]|nr:MAG: 30S ribosomal protein S20 [Candidatus Peribacteria bacterium]
MPITSSAKKALKRSRFLQSRNLDFKLAMKKSIKNVRKAIAAGDVAGLTDLLQVAYSTIDKAQQKNILHKNNAARKKSRLTKTVAKAVA